MKKKLVFGLIFYKKYTGCESSVQPWNKMHFETSRNGVDVKKHSTIIAVVFYYYC